MTGPPGMNADGSMTGMPVTTTAKTGTGIKYATDFVEPVNGKGGDGTAGSNNAGEVTGVNGWDGIQRGGEKVMASMTKVPVKGDADFVEPVMDASTGFGTADTAAASP